MAITQRYGIKFPFNIKSDDNTFFDLANDKNEKIKSELMHVLFTPKGQRLRDPDFGSNLIQYIYNPNDSQTWDDVKFELEEIVEKYVPDCKLEDISIYDVDDGRGLIADVKYRVKTDSDETVYQLVTTL